MRRVITGRMKMIFSVMAAVLFAIVAFAALPAADSNNGSIGAPGDYNAGDIAAVNNIINANGLGWTEDPGDGSAAASWPGVTWEHDGTEERITKLNISREGLTGTLDVSGLPMLLSLICSHNDITSLDISGLSALELLFCSFNNLSEIDLSDQTALRQLDCSSNNITSLDLSGLGTLVYLYCDSNNIASLDVSSLTQLEDMDCSHNKLTSLNVSALTHLEVLRCSHNKLTSLNVSALTQLAVLDCSVNRMTGTENVNGVTSGAWNGTTFKFSPQTITISEISGVTAPVAEEVPVTSITETAQFTGTIMWFPPAPETFGHSTVYTARISLTAKPGFTIEGIPVNYFTVDGATAAYAAGGNLVIIAFPKTEGPPPHHAGDIAVINTLIANNGLNWTPASDAQIADGKIPSDWVGAIWDHDKTLRRIIELNLASEDVYGDIDLTGLEALEEFYCYYNYELTSIDLSGLKALVHADCSFNGLISLNVSGCTALKYLDCLRNELRSLDVSGLEALEYLDCLMNELQSLDVSGLKNLEYLNCLTNEISYLNVSGCTALKYLDCYDNNLTVLDVTGCPLEFLDCSENYLANESKVIGFEGTWDDERFIFGSQKSLPDDGGGGFPILLAIAAVAIIAAVIVAAYMLFLRPGGKT